MSIRNRLEDARILSAAGRQEGAFIEVLIAAAATSRLRYPPNVWDDGEAFKNFIYDELGIITSGAMYGVVLPFQGKDTPLEDIFYHHLRCQLVHEGGMPESIIFTQQAFENGSVVNKLHLSNPLGFPAGWIERLATAVWLALENDEQWQDELVKRQMAREGFNECWSVHAFCRRPGQQTKAMKNKRERIEWVDGGNTFVVTFPRGVTTEALYDAIERQFAKGQAPLNHPANL